MQRKPSAPLISRAASSPIGSGRAAPPSVHEIVRSPGLPLDAATRAFFEPRFRYDFSQVRVHADDYAKESARAINALAYTSGQHLVFGENRYPPSESSSRHLIAHELAHFVQQRFTANSPALQRQDAEKTTTRAQYHGHEGDDLAIKILELADKGVHDSTPYKNAIRTWGPTEKRYVYANSYTLSRLADVLDLLSFDQCVALLNPNPRGKVLALMARIKKKYGFSDVVEDGEKWSESELEIADRRFSKMSSEERELLRGVRLIRKKEIPSETRHGKKFQIAGNTFGGGNIELTRSAFQNPFTILHEAGHLIQQKLPQLATQALYASDSYKALESARKKFNDAIDKANKDSPTAQGFAKGLHQMSAALSALVDSPPQAVQDNISRVELAQNEVEMYRASERSQAWLDAYERLKEYSTAVQLWAIEKQAVENAPHEIEEAFVDIVKKNKLDTPSFAPFTDYVAHSWPDKPQEFLVQCYATWRTDPDYIRRRAPKLHEWFASGGHLGKRK